MLTLVIAMPVVAQTTLESEKDKFSYAVGMELAKMLAPIKDDVDAKIVVEAFQTAITGGKLLLTDEEATVVRKAAQQRVAARQAAMNEATGSKNKAAGEAFLASNRSKPGVVVTASGLQYTVLRAGSGPKPVATDTVRVHYVGTLLDGTKFDSSYDRNDPAQFVLNRVIPGWTEGVALMPVGSKYKFWIPSALGYGQRGAGPIGPSSMLIFEVELLDIVGAADAR
jgi:FKBP-type peptidyl-prolyl cis-trans isomerase